MNRRLALAATACLALLLAACGSTDPGSPTTVAPAAAAPSAPPSSSGTSLPASPATSSRPPAAKPGAYIGYDEYTADKAAYDAAGRVVLFFHAGWCPTCKRAEANLTGSPLPAGLTVVKTDYDASDDLKRKYGVTVQHTFVQVAPDGAALAKFTGADTAQGILGRTV